MKRLALVVAALLLAGCSPISSGTVTGKNYTPAHVIYTQQCYPVGKVIVCQPYPIYVAAVWELDLRNGDKTGWVDVSKTVYRDTQIGDEFG